jgi:hypothetical protein
VFLRTERESGKVRVESVCCLDEMWANEGHSRNKSYWQVSDGPEVVRLIICHAGSAEGGFIPEGRSFFLFG